MKNRIQVHRLTAQHTQLRPAMHTCDACRITTEKFGSEIAEAADDTRTDEGNLLPEPGLTGTDLFRPWIAVIGRPILEHVGDEHLLTAEPDTGQQLSEQLAGRANEWPSLLILVIAGRLTDEHQARLWVSFAENRVRTRDMQVTASAHLNLCTQSLELRDEIVSCR